MLGGGGVFRNAMDTLGRAFIRGAGRASLAGAWKVSCVGGPDVDGGTQTGMIESLSRRREGSVKPVWRRRSSGCYAASRSRSMLSPMRAAEAFTVSRARCAYAYLAVVCTCV